MSGVNNGKAAARREAVLDRWAKGYSQRAIGRALGVDPQTVSRDVKLLGQQAVDGLDVPKELSRLLLAGRAVEADAWGRNQPMQALAAVKAQLAVLTVLQGLDLAQRVAELEQRLNAAQGVSVWQTPRVRSELKAGRN